MARTHEEIDQRSLALHARVCQRLREEPQLLEIAQANLERWEKQAEEDDPALGAIHEWQVILNTLPLDELYSLLVCDDERACRLRQSSPFAGILVPAEVWQIKRQFSSETASA
jgi:hypothetical protein